MSEVSHQTIVSIGSNIEPRKNFALSQKILEEEVVFHGSATIIETKPDGYQDQPDFLNGAYLLETTMSYNAFNDYLKKLEKRMGRVKGPIKSGPRCIDIDIIVWNGEIVHDDYHNQKHYVVIPVNEIIRQHEIQVKFDLVGGRIVD